MTEARGFNVNCNEAAEALSTALRHMKRKAVSGVTR